MNVPLAKIATNTELQSVFFDNRYSVVGENVPVKVRIAIVKGFLEINCFVGSAYGIDDLSSLILKMSFLCWRTLMPRLVL